MLSRFRTHLKSKFPFLEGKRLLLACSGGVDSMVMLDLFRKSGYEVGIAHCNFNLRGAESDQDESFIREFAAANHLQAHIATFDTEQFAHDFKLSIQLAARKLRYGYFGEILEAGKYDYVLTAHHADDNLETFLINLTRGTGIEGLTGIPLQNGNIVRPLLDFTRAEIESYAKSNGLEWREDSSNASEKYLRNKIRHQLVPALKEVRPDLLETFAATQDFLRQTQSLADDAAVLVFQKVAKTFGTEIRFDLPELKKLPNFQAYLYKWLSGFGFTAWSDIYALVDAQSGKQVFAPGHVLLKDRDALVLSPLTDEVPDREYKIYNGMETIEFPLKMSLKFVKAIGRQSNSAIFVDAEKLRFPLVLRRWKEGDVFYPLGMNGNSKKVSKFFKDGKFSLRDKEHAWLLCSRDDIIWIVGHRADERFGAQSTTTNILNIALKE
ncbi:tRNA lysidine(34) synthetase TilS [Flavobacterium selenitireducens]|uniref:tRNA lysidine(34) synthetase TilS n=1 Tax=Flavobacterium selenitireducens TaxID=2722704 RepID=UPI00168A5A02|nr:tRNA lysidine(34) synthetase TilS [Flavobacterium selenitireducens]MBD3581223.1 tRNA lysidine(34) synthetase TilS [Flavobacterium selenitireducens]